jgi:hypothetical protein
MRRAPHRLLSVSLLVLSIGCASSLRLMREPSPDRLADLRAEYFAMNPETPYRGNVERGEVVKGMDPFGVLASWGSPERRARDADAAERWVYIDTDENSGDSVEYALSFRAGVLDSWSTLRHTSGGQALRDESTVAATPAEAPTGKRVPQD